MQTYKSTCKLTSEIISEYQKSSGKLLDAALTLLAPLLVACVLFPITIPYLPNLSRVEWKLLLLPLFAIGFIFHLYILPHIHRAFLRSALRNNEKRFGTPSPTLETRIEDDTIITRCLETNSEDRSPIHGSAAIQTTSHIFIRLSRKHLAVFTIADFSPEVLDDLLSTLRSYNSEILPNS